MIARFQILLPYVFNVPEKQTYNTYVNISKGYKTRIYFPQKSNSELSSSKTSMIKIDGVDCFNADALQIDFSKDSFNREDNSPVDPPLELIQQIINQFLLRLRYVANLCHIKPIEVSNCSWNIEYLNDDFTELSEEKGFCRNRFQMEHSLSWNVFTNAIWENIHSLDPEQQIPVWKTLLLDAQAIMPEIGPAIILTNTALEVFISTILDTLAKSNEIDNDLWDWINSRSYSKKPSTEERYDFLAKFLIGASLKDTDKDLWAAFKNLRTVRNTYAHTGVATFNKQPLTIEKTQFFIQKSNDIIDLFRDYLPGENKWPMFKYNLNIQATKLIADLGED